MLLALLLISHPHSAQTSPRQTRSRPVTSLILFFLLRHLFLHPFSRGSSCRSRTHHSLPGSPTSHRNVDCSGSMQALRSLRNKVSNSRLGRTVSRPDGKDQVEDKLHVEAGALAKIRLEFAAAIEPFHCTPPPTPGITPVPSPHTQHINFTPTTAAQLPPTPDASPVAQHADPDLDFACGGERAMFAVMVSEPEEAITSNEFVPATAPVQTETPVGLGITMDVESPSEPIEEVIPSTTAPPFSVGRSQHAWCLSTATSEGTSNGSQTHVASDPGPSQSDHASTSNAAQPRRTKAPRASSEYGDNFEPDTHSICSTYSLSSASGVGVDAEVLSLLSSSFPSPPARASVAISLDDSTSLPTSPAQEYTAFISQQYGAKRGSKALPHPPTLAKVITSAWSSSSSASGSRPSSASQRMRRSLLVRDNSLQDKGPAVRFAIATATSELANRRKATRAQRAAVRSNAYGAWFSGLANDEPDKQKGSEGVVLVESPVQEEGGWPLRGGPELPSIERGASSSSRRSSKRISMSSISSSGPRRHSVLGYLKDGILVSAEVEQPNPHPRRPSPSPTTYGARCSSTGLVPTAARTRLYGSPAAGTGVGMRYRSNSPNSLQPLALASGVSAFRSVVEDRARAPTRSSIAYKRSSQAGLQELVLGSSKVLIEGMNDSKRETMVISQTRPDARRQKSSEALNALGIELGIPLNDPSTEAVSSHITSPTSSSKPACVHPPEMACLAGCCSQRSATFTRIISTSTADSGPSTPMADDVSVSRPGVQREKTLKNKTSFGSIKMAMKRSKSSPSIKSLASGSANASASSPSPDFSEEAKTKGTLSRSGTMKRALRMTSIRNLARGVKASSPEIDDELDVDADASFGPTTRSPSPMPCACYETTSTNVALGSPHMAMAHFCTIGDGSIPPVPLLDRAAQPPMPMPRPMQMQTQVPSSPNTTDGTNSQFASPMLWDYSWSDGARADGCTPATTPASSPTLVSSSTGKGWDCAYTAQDAIAVARLPHAVV